ncbi:zinc finger protein 40 [Aplochiton taeniatus]
MPRTKQNHPKNLKDKIEEAQKELKDPKGSQKGATENSQRNADSIKGLKRKKVVAENQQKKIPKSPVKKPSQSKTSEAAPHGGAATEAPPSCSYPSSPAPNGPAILRGEPEYAPPVAASPEGRTTSVDHEKLKREEGSSSGPPSLDPTRAEEVLTLGTGECQAQGTGERSHGEVSSYHASAPLDVLLKAMEPDFSTLTERKKTFPAAAIGKPDLTHAPQSSREGNGIPAVHFGLRNQPTHMQTYYVDKPGNYISIGTPLQGNMQASTQAAPLQAQQVTQHFIHTAASREKPALHLSFSTGISSTVTHAPVPPGSSPLPQSQPPVVQTCQSLSASVPSTIQVPVTPGYNQLQMGTVMNFGGEQVYSISTKDQKPKKQGKYVCEYCSRACAKPSVLLKHIRSHTGERPYPCVTCGFSFKTKSNLYKHKKSHAHAIKLGLVARSDSGAGSLCQESDKAIGTNSDAEESGDSDEESSPADLDPDSSQSSVAAFSESSLQSGSAPHGNHGEADHPVGFELKAAPGQRCYESRVAAALPKVVVYPVNVSPLRADSPRVTDAPPEQAASQRQREFQAANMRASLTVLSSLKEVDYLSASQDNVSDDEDQQCKSPPAGGHAQLQRQQATDFSQPQQGKCLLSPRSLGSTDSGYFSRSESADQAMSPPSPFVKITPPTDMEVSKNVLSNLPVAVATIMHVAAEEKPGATQGQMRPPLEAKALSLEERISKLISDNEAVVDNKQLDSVKPRRTSLSRRGSIDSPKSYIFKDSFQFDLKPIGRRSSSSSDIPKSPFTPTDKSKPVFLLSVPPQYPPMDCLPITRSHSMPSTPGHSAIPLNVAPTPHPLRVCQSFDDKMSSLNDDVFSSAPSTPNPVLHSRTLVRQVAIEDFSTSEGHGLPTVRSMDEGYMGHGVSTEIIQRSRSFEHGQDRNRKPLQGKGTMYECETCRNRYRKLENFENHKKFYCSELHGPKNKAVVVKETEQDVFQVSLQHSIPHKMAGVTGLMEQQREVRKRRKMKSVGDDEDQSPTETIPPCSVSFDSCQLPTAMPGRPFHPHPAGGDIQPSSNPTQPPQIQLIARSTDACETRLSPIRETQSCTSGKERGELQRQGSGTSVIRHTNSLSRPSSFETSESIERASPVDFMEKDSQSLGKTKADTTTNASSESYNDGLSKPKGIETGKQGMDQSVDGTGAVPGENSTPVHQSKLVRQNNIQVPEILVTEEPDREYDIKLVDPGEKTADTFNWPQRSESLSKVPAEKLPPKKKRIRLAQMEHSSGESSFESSLSRSLSRDSSLSRCSSISASFDRDEPSRSESPSRGECVAKVPEPQGLPTAFNTLGVPGMMRRAASEQISCTQPSVEIACDYRSKSFDCGSVSPHRSLSPVGTLAPPAVQVPLIERRRGPLVRQMSLKIAPESQQHVRKHVIPLEKLTITNVSQHRPQQIHIANKPSAAQPFTLHSGDTMLQKNEQSVQSIHLGSQTQQPQVYGLPHPWHETSRVQTCQKLQQPLSQILISREDAKNKSTDSEEKKSLVPKYQLQCHALKASQTYTFCGAQATQRALPVLTIPIANQILSVSKSSDVRPNVYVSQQATEIKTQSILLPGARQRDLFSPISTSVSPLPQILITHEQMNPVPSVPCKGSFSSFHIVDPGKPPASDRPQAPVKHSISTQCHSTESQRTPSLGSLHCTQKMASVTLSPQQEPAASSKRMLSPANSLDIAMEKHQKRAKDEHSVGCLTDGRSVNYLNSKMAEVTRRKLMLVRQVCTTEPADSPIETEAPSLPQGKADEEKEPESPKPMSPDSVGQEPSTAVAQGPGPALNATPAPAPATSTLKPQDRSEEQRWSPAKALIRPSTFHGGQVKLASSVSVVNSRDSQRLSFPSLKTATTFTWCFLMKRKPLHIPQSDLKISAYATWAINPNNPNPMGLPTKVVMSLFDSKQTSKKIHYTSAIITSGKSDILSYSSKLKDAMPKVLKTQKSVTAESSNKGLSELSNETDKDPSSSKTEPRRVKIFDGGFKSNEEYVYVRGRGRGKYICEECGIRCKKPSMLRKHIRTHSDVRPYHCNHCNFSFKTKGNLTKHMKSKAHSKKCMEMGVPDGLIEDQDADDSAGDRSQAGSADRPDSDGEDSEGADDEDNEDNEEEEEDSQAESGLSTNPSVSASPQHFPSTQAEIPPSALLAQMSINPAPLPPPPPPSSDAQASDGESVPMMSPVSLCRQMSISGSCSSPGPLPYSPPPLAHPSDGESVPMMSPVSPCRQMSIDYPDFEGPPSPPAPGKGSKLGQVRALRPPSPSDGSGALLPTPAESGSPVDRGTQTSDHGSLHFPSQGLAPQEAGAWPAQTSDHGSLHFPSQGLAPQEAGVGPAQTHLFSHLPLHSQQPARSPYSMVPARSPYSMVPVGGIQLVPAGLAAYSTFVQAGPVQLTIPAGSVIHRNTSPLPAPYSPPRPDGLPAQPLVVQEPVSSVLPCFPLGQVARLQAQTVHPTLGLEALSVMGLTNAGLAQQGLTLNATLGLQVLATRPTSQSRMAAQTQGLPGLQILNISLPALIPSLSPLPAPSLGIHEALGGHAAQTDAGLGTGRSSASASPVTPCRGQEGAAGGRSCPAARGPEEEEAPQPAVEKKKEDRGPSSQKQLPAASTSREGVGRSLARASSQPAPPRPPPLPRQHVTDDYSEASSDDEDRLVIAT